MSNQKIAMDYLRCFCAGDIDSLEPLLADNLHFSGTLHSYHSAKDYLDSLKNDPPEACDFKVLSITERDQHVALFYEYQKPVRTMIIAQLFKIKNDRIHEILLVFDSRGFD